MSEVIHNCAHCGNAVFDTVWGEYKCLVDQHVELHSQFMIACANWKALPKGEAVPLSKDIFGEGEYQD